MSVVTVPNPPAMPISVVPMQWNKNATVNIEDSSITDWKAGMVFALIPYIDLPHSVLKKEGIACLTSDGQRGWISLSICKQPFCRPPEKMDFDPIYNAMIDSNWEPILIEQKDIDLEKQFAARGDDGGYDLTAETFWIGKCCEWCGHPVTNNQVPCESCDAVPSDIPIVQAEDGHIFQFKEDLT